MPGGHKKIHKHPNAGINGFDKRPQDAGHPGGTNYGTIVRRALDALPKNIAAHLKGLEGREALATEMVVLAFNQNIEPGQRLKALIDLLDRIDGNKGRLANQINIQNNAPSVIIID